MSQQHGEFDDLEQALRQVPLRAPSPNLDRRIAQALQRRPATRWLIGLAAATLAAAAALLLIVRATGSNPEIPSPQPAPTLIAKASATTQPSVSQLVQTDEQWSEDGIVDVQADGPVRQYRLITTHQITEIDNGKLVTMTFPQEEVYQVVSEAFYALLEAFRPQ